MPIRDEEAQDEDKIERRRNMWRNARWRKHIDNLTSVVAPNSLATKRLNTMSDAEELDKLTSAEPDESAFRLPGDQIDRNGTGGAEAQPVIDRSKRIVKAPGDLQVILSVA
eukprot:COSAG01_NODE_7715_length_3048_cov_7.664324_4_plen_111_part_00